MLLPLKQGLKLTVPVPVSGVRKCCYATSIKTRIETAMWTVNEATGNSCYATSIKTRIETQPCQSEVQIRRCCYATSIKTRIETRVAIGGASRRN